MALGRLQAERAAVSYGPPAPRLGLGGQVSAARPRRRGHGSGGRRQGGRAVVGRCRAALERLATLIDRGDLGGEPLDQVGQLLIAAGQRILPARWAAKALAAWSAAAWRHLMSSCEAS